MSFIVICTLNPSGANPDGQGILRISRCVSNESCCLTCPYLRLVSKISFEEEPEIRSPVLPQSSPSSPSFRQTRLNRFVHSLAVRPNDPPHDLNDPNLRNSGVVSSNITTSMAAQRTESMLNPEADSFAYMETVLESFAVLGKLASALDIVVQRVPSEIYNLVETTLDEVSERAEYSRAGAMYSLNNSASRRTEGAYVFSTTDSSTTAFSPTVVPNADFLSGAQLRLSALEASAKQVDHEVLKDFFWTFYSKMDAVAQGLRVIYEVANRIGTVSFHICILYLVVHK